jgi:class 3 adenylate cyclase/tetratricopeptide (TPR) repeat protein
MPSKQTGLGPRIDKPAGLSLTSNEERILQIMFASYHRVAVMEEFFGGLSGGQVLSVRPIRSEGSPELPAAVKIAPAGLIRKEWQAYQDHVRNRLPGIAEITGETVLPLGNPLGGLRYTLMGEGGTFDIESLYKYCDRAAIADIRCVLEERLFRIVGPNWWQIVQVIPAWPVRASYDFLLPVNLLIRPATPPPDASPHQIAPGIFPSQPLSRGDDVRLEGFVITEVDVQKKAVTLNLPPREDGLPASYRLRLQPVEAIEACCVGDEIAPIAGRVMDTRRDQLQSMAQNVLGHLFDLTADTLTSPHGIPLPNPLTALPALLGRMRTVKMSCIHGDLNMENVLVEPAGRGVSLIDFATARRDHALHDLLRLETEVITKLLSQVLSGARLLVETIDVFYRQLHETTCVPQGSVSPSLSRADLEKPFEMLVTIRKMARQCLFDQNDWTEYYEGLILYLLGALKFKNLDRLSKQVAFWAAAVVYNFLEPVLKGPPPVKDWGRLQKYLPAEMYQKKDEATCLVHLNALLRAVLTYLPRHVALDLLGKSAVAQNRGQFLEGTLLFADLSDFTVMSERLRKKGQQEGAEEIVCLINKYLDVMLAILFRYNGRLIKFGGDSMLCLFTGEVQGAMNAVRAAWEMKQTMADRFAKVKVLQEVYPLAMKAGSNSGLLFAANVGTPEHMEYVLTGSAVERTARAESAAEKGDILVSSETYALVKDYLDAEQLAAMPDFYRVTGIRAEEISASEDPWNEIEQFLSIIENDLWAVVDRLDVLTPYLPAGVLPQLTYDSQEGEIEGQHRQVTVLFANFIGMSNVISAHGVNDPEGITADLGRYFRLMQEEVFYYGGVINKVDLYDQGDKLMVIFGAPQAHERDAQRAALTALAMQQAISRLSRPASLLLSQRIGIHTGSVFAGNVGSRTCNRCEYTVMGDTVNLAARLMAAAGTSEIWASRRVWDQIQAGFEAKELRSVQLKGISEPVTAYQLLTTRGVQEGRVWSRVLDSEMVGRETELAELEACFDALLSGIGKQIVAIIAETGVGKTRLVAEWQARVGKGSETAESASRQGKGAAVTWLTGRGHSYGQKAHGVFIDILEELLGFANDDTEEERWAKLSPRLVETFAGATEGWIHEFNNRLAFLGAFLALDPSTQQDLAGRMAQMGAEASQLQTRLAICDLLTHAAQEKPLVLILEDLHWADEASLSMLTFILDRVSDDAPVLFCLVFRPRKEHCIWPTWQEVDRSYPDCLSILLQELDEGEGRQLLFNLMENSHLPKDFQTLVLDATDGNPLYVEEVLHALIEDGTIVQDEGEWQITRGVEHIRVPDTLYQIIQSRVDELDFGSPGARRVLWMASVIGEEFAEGLLRHLFASTGRPAKEFAQHFRELRNAAMIKRSMIEANRVQQAGRPQWGYRFQHGLVQQVAYENMLVEKRREYHGEVGRWLEEWYSQDLPRHCDALAHHYDQARQWSKAFEYRWLVGKRDAQAYANQEAVSHLTRALEIAPYVAPGMVMLARVRFELGKVFSTLGQYKDACEHLGKAYALFGESLVQDAALRQAEVCYHIGRAYEQQGSEEALEAAAEWQEKGEALLPPVPTAEGAMVHALRGIISLRQGDFEQAIKAGEESLRLARAVDARSELSFAHRMVSLAAHVLGRLDLAMEHCERSIEVCLELSDLIGLAKNYSNKGVFAFEMDDWELAEEAYLQALATVEQVGDRFEIARVYCNLGDLYCHRADDERGDIGTGLDYAQHSLDIFDTMDALPGIITARAVLATLLWRQEELAKAEEQLLTAKELTREAVMFKPTVGRWLAQVYLAAGDVDQAEAEIETLLFLDVDVLADDAEPIQRLRGEILAARGELDEAERMLKASLVRLERTEKRYQVAQACLSLARVLARTEGRETEALAHAERARDTFADLGARMDQRDAEALISELRRRMGESANGK